MTTRLLLFLLVLVGLVALTFGDALTQWCTAQWTKVILAGALL